MITIFTPTYNRKNLLLKLFKTLTEQTNKDFEWLIVDDGSTDGTKEWFESLKYKTYDFPIRYFWKENGGKHTAYNKAIQLCKGNFFFCVDSDDYLLPESINIILNDSRQYVSDEIIGMVYPRINSKNEICGLNGWEKIDKNPIDIIDAKELYNIKETAIVIRTDILKKYSFPINKDRFGENEKFCPETILYNFFISEGKFLALCKGFYVSEYRNDGLTKNVFNLWMQNSNSVIESLTSKYFAMKKYSFKKRFYGRLKCVLNINALCIKLKISLFKNSPSIMYSLICIIPSCFFKIIRFDKNWR